jgi:hypothetical protein
MTFLSSFSLKESWVSCVDRMSVVLSVWSCVCVQQCMFVWSCFHSASSFFVGSNTRDREESRVLITECQILLLQYALIGPISTLTGLRVRHVGSFQLAPEPRDLIGLRSIVRKRLALGFS